MKVLILSCGTGEGHNSAARAVLEKFRAEGIEAELKDTLLFASERASRYVCGIYKGTTLHAPRVFGAAYKAGELISSSKRKSPIYLANMAYADALYNYITDNDIDTVLSPHLFPAEAITRVRAKYKTDFSSYVISTDYSCCPFFEETNTDRFFIPHESLKDDFTRRGISPDKIVCTGIPVGSEFRNSCEKSEARRLLSIADDLPLMLIMTGSMGYGSIEELVGKLMTYPVPTCRVAVLCGRNEELKKNLAAKFPDADRLLLVEFTNKVSLYMDAADIVFTKPGGLSSTEAAAKRIPIVHTSPIPGCETQNAKFFSKLGMSLYAKNSKQAADAAIKIIINEKLRKKMTAAQERNINPYAADRIFAAVIADKKQKGE